MVAVSAAGLFLASCDDRTIVDPATSRSTSANASGALGPDAAPSADSATASYLKARHALDRGDTTAAIAHFDHVIVRWSQSKRAPHAMYWKAFVLDRRGGEGNLQIAHQLLELATQIAPTSYAIGDAATLLLRVRARLASAGDRVALDALGVASLSAWRACADSTGADRLSWAVDPALLPAARLARLRTIMRSRGKCAAPVREQVLLLLARAPDGAGIAEIVRAADEDESLAVRRSAMRVLPEPASDDARAVLERVLATEHDVTLLEAAASAWRSRTDWGTEPLQRYLRRADRNATVADYVETLLRR